MRTIPKQAPPVLLGIALVWLLGTPPTLAQTPLFARGYTVIPVPQKVELNGGDFEFGSGWRLDLGPGVKPDDVAIESLRDGLSSRFGVTLEKAGEEHDAGGTITLTIQPGGVPIGLATDRNRRALEEQAYKLELASRAIRITANADAGLFYGVETLVQLVKPASGRLCLPAGVITDWPDLELRNILWEDLFHVEHVDVLKEALRQAAFYKINGFVLKLDDHFQYKSAPALAAPSALSPEQVQELTNYGLRYHVQLIPYLDAPAHIPWILKHPEYAGLREFPDSNYEMCTTNPDSYKLLEGMFQDLLDANQGVKYFVLSTDEPYYVGLADNAQCHSAQLTRQLGSVGKVLAAFLDKAAGYLHESGRTVIFWGEYPLKPGDIASLPSYLVNGEVYGPEFDRAFKARGIRQMIFTSNITWEQFLFPDYYIPPDMGDLAGRAAEAYVPAQPGPGRVAVVFDDISNSPERREADLMGTFLCGWDTQGTHMETMWLGYAAGSAPAWHPGGGSPEELMASFYRLFYGPGAIRMGRVYQLMSEQGELWKDSWQVMESDARKPLFGDSQQIYPVRRPAYDQTLPLPPVPDGEYLRLTLDAGARNLSRVRVAQGSLPELDELCDLLLENMYSVNFNHYNLEVFLSIAALYRQNLEMILGMDQIDKALEQAEDAAAKVEFQQAVAALDRALDTAQKIKQQRNSVLAHTVSVWYRSWYPRVPEANGRRYLLEVDDAKDYLPYRTADMTYLVYREIILPLGRWYSQVEAARNHYAQAHQLPLRSDQLDWEDTRIGRD